jgi:hypothetical protein
MMMTKRMMTMIDTNEIARTSDIELVHNYTVKGLLTAHNHHWYASCIDGEWRYICEENLDTNTNTCPYWLSKLWGLPGSDWSSVGGVLRYSVNLQKWKISYE